MIRAPRLLVFLTLIGLLAPACRSVRPTGVFDPNRIPVAPDYADLRRWAAHPQTADPADRTPTPDRPERQATAEVDVFFLYPTSFYGPRRKPVNWNADMGDMAVNNRTDSTSILHQSTIFNRVGRVFAPRYRQAHLNAFFSKDKHSAAQALDVAYTDVRAAFEYYLEHWNNGRPFIIAAHSQGAFLGARIIRDRIEGTPLEDKMVLAYLAGWPIRHDYFRKLKPCKTPEETGCFCSWRTWKRNAGLRKRPEPEIVCVNPLTWSTQEGEYAPKSLNKGAILRDFNVVYPAATDAEVRGGFLLAAKPKFPGSIFFIRKNYHIGDLNLYYFNIQENVELRAQRYLNQNKH